MTLIPGFIRDDDSTEAGAANFATFRGIKGNRAYYSSNRGVRSITMNPFSAREFGYGAVPASGTPAPGPYPAGRLRCFVALVYRFRKQHVVLQNRCFSCAHRPSCAQSIPPHAPAHALSGSGRPLG